jgi:hypothetical protein
MIDTYGISIWALWGGLFGIFIVFARAAFFAIRDTKPTESRAASPARRDSSIVASNGDPERSDPLNPPRNL